MTLLGLLPYLHTTALAQPSRAAPSSQAVAMARGTIESHSMTNVFALDRSLYPAGAYVGGLVPTNEAADISVGPMHHSSFTMLGRHSEAGWFQGAVWQPMVGVTRPDGSHRPQTALLMTAYLVSEYDSPTEAHAAVQLNGKEQLMTLRHAIATASALLLLGSTTVGPFDSRTLAKNAAGSPVTRPISMSVARSYLDILDHQGPSGHDYQALDRLYAPRITLTESMTTGRPRSHIGLRKVQAFDRWNRLDWIADKFEQLSPTVVLTIERPRKGPGHELLRTEPWVTLFTIRNGKIVNLVWMPY